MKKTLFIALLAVLLTACAAPTTIPSATVPETMAPSSTIPPSEVTVTSIPDVVLTATPTEAISEATQESGYLDVMEIKKTDEVVDYEYMGQPVSVSFGIDSSVKNFSNITMPDALAARLGTLAYESLFAPDLARDDAGIREFNTRRAEGPLTVTIEAYSAHESTQDPEQMTLALVSEGMTVPEDAIAINKVNFVYGFWYENPEQGVFEVNESTPWFTLSRPKNGMGFGMMVDKNSGEVYVFVGFDYLEHGDPKIDRGVGAFTNISFRWLNLTALGRLSSTLKMDNSDPNYGQSLLDAGLEVR